MNKEVKVEKMHNDEVCNYRVDLFFEYSTYIKKYEVYYPEFWMATNFANSLKNEDNLINLYILERASDGEFDITRMIK